MGLENRRLPRRINTVVMSQITVTADHSPFASPSSSPHPKHRPLPPSIGLPFHIFHPTISLSIMSAAACYRAYFLLCELFGTLSGL